MAQYTFVTRSIAVSATSGPIVTVCSSTSSIAFSTTVQRGLPQLESEDVRCISMAGRPQPSTLGPCISPCKAALNK